MTLTVASFFAGAGGLDVGFKNAGFDVVWANEFDKDIWDTYRHNHPQTTLETRSIFDIPSWEVPNTDGIIGGPPCQSWSAAGNNQGSLDLRGQAFFEYIRILRDKSPKFFVIENVEGLTRTTHQTSFQQILTDLESCGRGYNLVWEVLTASDYEVPQDRKRLFIIGIRKDILLTYQFPQPSQTKVTLKDAIWDLKDKPVSTKTSVTSNSNCYLEAGWSSNFMSRNRVRGWDEFAFTVPASSRHVTMHPQAPKMVSVSKDQFQFVKGSEHLYRRFTIAELSRIQTFPDDYFVFNNINTAHKMIGNAVPCKLAEAVATPLQAISTAPQKPLLKITLLPKKLPKID